MSYEGTSRYALVNIETHSHRVWWIVVSERLRLATRKANILLLRRDEVINETLLSIEMGQDK